MSAPLTQSPAPGAFLVRHAGDDLTIALESPDPLPGRPWLRTNLRHAARRRAATVAFVERGEPLPSDDWEDLPMRLESPRRAVLTVSLTDPGMFGAKAFALRDERATPQWPAGEGNAHIKVEPAWTVAGNGIYSAFVRMYRDRTKPDFPDADLRPLDDAGYSVIPPSGTFRALGARLDHILGDLGFRIVMLLPPFPVPTTHARMGRFGSPFAPRDFYDVDPALADADRRTTPLEQFAELTDGIHARGGRLFIDVPINHTGWASRTMAQHPEWFVRNPDGTFHSPGAWGVTWADLVQLDYSQRALWREMAEVFLFWCRQGVDGFRCDAGYMVPLPVWDYIAAKVRIEFPDTVFLLEGLGGPVRTTLDLITAGGLNWAYSELFQNYDRGAVDWYLPQALEQSATHGLHIHFAETHDNDRLAAKSQAWSRMRTALAALAAPAGGWGIACGVEWFAAEKIRVHGATDLNEGAAENQVAAIAALNALHDHPAFQAGAGIRSIARAGGTAIALLRTPADGKNPVLAIVNLDDVAETDVSWEVADFPGRRRLRCLRTGADVRPSVAAGVASLRLGPGECLCLAAAVDAVPVVPVAHRRESQAAAAVAKEVLRWFGADDIPDGAPAIADDPAEFCRRAAGLPFAPVTRVHWPRDGRRNVVWLAGDWLLATAGVPFRWRLDAGGTGRNGSSLAARDGTFFALIPPPRDRPSEATLSLRTLERTQILRGSVPLTLPGTLTDPEFSAAGDAVRADPEMHVVLTNGAGAMSHVPAAWGTLRSQYDSLLAANLSDRHPTDRQVVFTRCRAWVVRRGFSTEISAAWTTSVRMLSGGCARWEFAVPCGGGHVVSLSLHVLLQRNGNSVALAFERAGDDDAGPVSIILRPDVEDRGFHEKWQLGPDDMRLVEEAMTFGDRRFTVPCRDGELTVSLDAGKLVRESERLTVEHPADARRGLGGHSTLFSPGWFRADLAPGEPVRLTASLVPRGMFATPPPDPPEPAECPAFSLPEAVRQFIVRRDDTQTVIAGYPWFLDWGRDTLICLRGIAAAGERDAVRSILLTFARFEYQGTLPNMIRGEDDSNRNTSDAPLWFAVAVADHLRREGNDDFLRESAGGRTIRDILVSIARHYRARTPAGVGMDPNSGLIFSPSHFTWMDTNHPAGTPRQGYPICIQALWVATLEFLAKIDRTDAWAALARMVRKSILARFVRPEGWLSDCLHAAPGVPAADAVADDHLRPNQLLAVTLGAIDDPGLRSSVTAECLELLVPGALRTLADRPVTVPLPVSRHGRLLNDPLHPFQPQYRGDEDTQRKPAYHNGTAWNWLMPMLAEAMVVAWGPPALSRAESVLASSLPLFGKFCLGHLEEIRDGAAPHLPGGCGAQAWSLTEWVRVREYLASIPPPEIAESGRKSKKNRGISGGE